MSSFCSTASSTASCPDGPSMRIWRIARAAHAADASRMLSGMGAALMGGRWNPIGMRAVYCSETSSLAMLEMLVHTQDVSTAPAFGILQATIPNDAVVEPDGLYDVTDRQKAGASVLKEHLAFAVPSVVNPLERNVVINPLHPHFHQVQTGAISAFHFDRRLH